MYVSKHLQTRVEFVKCAMDGSYEWLRLKRVVQVCSEVYFCICHMPQKKVYKTLMKKALMLACRMIICSSKALELKC